MHKNKYIDRAFEAARKEIIEDQNLSPAKLLYRSSRFRTPVNFFYKRFDNFKDTPKTVRHSASDIYTYAVYLENSDSPLLVRLSKTLGARLYSELYMMKFTHYTLELVEEKCGFFHAVAAANLIHQLRSSRKYEADYVINTIRAVAINNPKSIAEVLDRIYQSIGNSKALLEIAKKERYSARGNGRSDYSV